LIKQVALRSFFIIIFFWINISIFSYHSYGQRYYFEHFQVEHGISNNTASCVLQDQKGFIWVGTKDGLNRFDGYAFKIFRNEKNDSTSLGNNSVWKLFESSNGTIWVGTEHGVFAYDPKLETFSHAAGTPKQLVRAMVEDSDGNMWFIINFRLYMLSAKAKKVTAIQGEQLDFCTSLTLSTKKEIWVATMYGSIGRFNVNNKKFQFYSLFNHSPAPVSPWLERIFDTGEGYLLIGTATQGIKKFNLSNNTYEDVLIYNADNTEIFARDFLKIKPDEYWIATESGIYIYNTALNTFVNLRKDYQNPYAISDNAVYSFCMDKQGGIWIGTYFGGINYLPNKSLVFQKYFPQFGTGSIKANAIREITSDNKENLWIGTEDDGLYQFNPQTGIFSNYKPSQKGQSIAHTNIHGLAYAQSKLWVGTFEHGLDAMQLPAGIVSNHYTANPASGLRSNFIHSLYKTAKDQLWVGTSNGIYLYNQKDNNFITPDYFPREAFYSSILELSDGSIIAGTFQDGLHYYSPLRNTYGRIQIIKDNVNLLAENRITYLFESKDKTIWIASEDKLYNINTKTNDVLIFSTTTGLPSNMIYTIAEDARNNKWITTSKGLVLMDRQYRILRIFTKMDGLLNDQFNYSSCYKTKDGTIYLGSVKGLVSFNPEDLKMEHYTPSVYITNISFFNNSLSVNPEKGPLRRSTLITEEITLPHDQSTFHIDFAALNFTSPGNIEYAYKLEYLDKKWNYIKKSRRVYFTNLAPGSYLFRVRSTDGDGKWAPNEKTLRIQILPPWWRTNRAYFIYSLLAALGVWGIVAFYHNRQLEKQQRSMEVFERIKEKEMYESKIDFFTKIAHEIRTPLTLIKAPLEKLMRGLTSIPQKEKYLAVMNKNTDRLLDLTNQLLDFRRLEAGAFALSLEERNINDLTKGIWNNFIPLAESKRIQMNFEAERAYSCKIDEEATTKIISNLLDNAIKYCNSMVQLSITTQENGLATIQISNDGPLIPADLRKKIFEPFFRSKKTDKITGTGLGLALSRSLAELQGGSLSMHVTDLLNVFVLKLPVQV